MRLVALLALAAGAPSADAESSGFREQVVPILEKYCARCHGPEKPKGGLNLAKYADEAAVLNDRKAWAKVLEFVEAGEMPPEGKPRPSQAEAELVTHWLQARLSKADCKGPVDPGRVTMRRLNRSEYNNTIRDLVGVAFRPADDFPLDDVGYGFDNIGDVLTLSPILMERYLGAAEKVAEQAIVVGEMGGGPVKRWAADGLGESAGFPVEGGRMLASAGEVVARFDVPRRAEYRFRVRAFGEQAGKEPVRMAFRVDGKTVATVDVPATRSAPAVYEAKIRSKPGKRRLSVAFLNDFYDEKIADPKRRDRNLWVDYLEVQGPSEHRPPPESHQRIIFQTPNHKGQWAECAAMVLERFASRAFRRPATPEEVARLVRFVDQADRDGERFERGIQMAVEAVLISPHFLYRVEVNRKARGPSEPLTDFELASRLSYFVWSSMPDDTLFALAKKGTLHEPATLEAQTRRMLKDPRSVALIEDFAGQWLQTRNLGRITPDPARFPEFDEALRRAMRIETEKFFGAILREDRSVLDFLDADYTFLNARLAKHYGIQGIEGDHFRRVKLQDGRRGGILTQASVLTVTSNPTRTSPVKRGKWILEQVLGTPPPPPPPGVGDLKDDKTASEAMSLRRRMEIHRSNPDCAACHGRMDPLGFGLENYDAIGAWRERDGNFPIDAAGKLPSGQAFVNPGQLKRLLATKDKEFLRCLAGKMLTYALGRGLNSEDQCVVGRVAEAVANDNSRFSRLVIEVVKSDPFRLRGPVETRERR